MFKSLGKKVVMQLSKETKKHTENLFRSSTTWNRAV